MGLNILLLLRNKGIILDLELLVGSIIMGSYLVFRDVGWSLARDRNIGTDILLRYSQNAI